MYQGQIYQYFVHAVPDQGVVADMAAIFPRE